MQITAWQWPTNLLTLTNTKYENFFYETFFLQSTWQMLKLNSNIMEDLRKWAFIYRWCEKRTISRNLS